MHCFCRFFRFFRRLNQLAVVVVALSLGAACTPPDNTGRSTSTELSPDASATPAVQTAQPAQAPDNRPLRGVALSPRSYDGSDLPDFLDIVDGSLDMVMHAGDWGELADETSAFRVLSELASQRSLETMIVLSPSNGTGLLRPLDDSTVDSYLTTLRAFLEDYQPRYLGLGNELNLVHSQSVAEYEQTVALFRAALPIVRELAPDTTVFVTLQYEWLLGRRDGWFGRENDPTLNQWDLLKSFDAADAIGITTYPGLVFDSPEHVPVDYYDDLLTRTDLPLVITESGWSADDTTEPPGSELQQATWASSLLERADRLAAEAVIWTFLFSTQVSEPAFADMGLWGEEGEPRPGWNIWSDTSGSASTVPAEPGLVSPAGGVSSLSEVWSADFTGGLPLTAFADTAGRNHVYVASMQGGISVLDAAGLRLATVERQQLADFDATHLAQSGTLLVAALGDFFGPPRPAGLAVIDVADPGAPAVLGTWESSVAMGGSADIVIEGTTIYLGAMEHGVFTIDISDPTNPLEIDHLVLDPDFPRASPGPVARPNARGLALSGELLYVANDAGGLRVVDASEPANLREIGRYINSGASKQQAYNDVLVAGGRAYVSLDYCGLEILDVSDPAAISQIAWLDPWDCNSANNLWLNSPGHGNELAYDESRQIVWMSAGDSELLAIDVSDARDPLIAAQVGEPKNGRGSYGLGATSGADPTVYLTYITAVVPFAGLVSEVVALKPVEG